MQQDPATNRTLACNFENKELQIALHHFELESGENAGVDAWWTDYGNWNSPLFSNPGWQCELDAAPFGQGTRDFSSPASLWSSYVRTSRLVQKGKRPFRLGIYGGIDPIGIRWSALETRSRAGPHWATRSSWRSHVRLWPQRGRTISVAL